MPTCAILSFRLGLTDGVSVVADGWRRVLERLGFEVTTIAAEGPVDVTMPGLAIGAPGPPMPEEVEKALVGIDLVVVENLCTIPLNLPAARTVAEVLRGRPAVLHHHDPPWQRDRFRGISELPPDDRAWRHVTINELTRHQMADRGITATTIYNGFEVAQPPGDRAATRALLGIEPDELLVGHPVRAIRRKGIPAAIDLCRDLGATYWLLGDAEEDYADELATLLDRARCRVVHRRLPPGPDIYAAPDLIAYPSTWEGFGNPPVEASLHLRPVAVGPYPVGRELQALGFLWFPVDDRDGIARFLAHPDPDLLEHNRRVVEAHFSLEAVTERLAALLGEVGWLP